MPYPYDQLPGLLQASTALRPSAYAQDYAADPTRTMGYMQRFTGNMLDESPVAGTPGLVQYQAPQDDSVDAMDVAKTIFGLPFGLLRVGRETIEDALGHRNSTSRARADAMIEQFEPMIQQQMEQQQRQDALRRTLTPEQGATMGVPLQMVSAAGSADEHPTGGQPNAMPSESRTPWLPQWFRSLTHNDREEKLGRIQAYLRAQQYDMQRRAGEAEIGTDLARGDLLRSQTAGSDWKNEQGYRYDDLLNMLSAGEKRANIGQSNAAAAHSYAGAGAQNALAGKYGAETAGEWEAQGMKRDQYWNRDSAAFDLDMKSRRATLDRENQGFRMSETERAAKLDRETAESAAKVAKDRALAERREGGGASDYPKLAGEETKRRQLYADTFATLVKGGMGEDQAAEIAGAIAGVEVEPAVDPIGPFGDRPARAKFEEFDPFSLKGRTPDTASGREGRSTEAAPPAAQSISESHPQFDQFYNQVSQHPKASGLSHAEKVSETLKLMEIARSKGQLK